ncbi:MAG: hypothetical protein ACNI26_04660 [Terasakiella sp.]|uniref:hypothetical protein n=1 Tax=unclassified Terasakiella TaxID=2614952 RepID=UPI003B000BEE
MSSVSQAVPASQTDRQLAMIQVNEQGKTQDILGYIVASKRAGRNQPVSFYNQNDRKVCEGQYHIRPHFSKGELDVSCFNGRIRGSGEFFIAGHRNGRTYGTAVVRMPTSHFRLVYGLTEEQYEQRRKGLMTQ